MAESLRSTKRLQLVTEQEATNVPYMSDAPSREETRAIIDDKIEALEARTDTKFAELKGEMMRVNDNLTRLSADFARNRSESHNWMIAIVAIVVASALAVGAMVLASQANMFHAFSAGISVGEH